MKCSSVILIVFLHVTASLAQEDYCFTNDDEKKQTRHYATKTPYEIARGTDKSYFEVPKCIPVKFWMLSRHGTRNPSAKAIEQLRQLKEFQEAILENFKRHDRDRHLNQLCSEDLELLSKWKFDRNLTGDYAEYLTVQGWNDLKYMAIDYQKSFQNLISTRYTKENFRFGYTNTQRTEASFKAFVEGLFGNNAEKYIEVIANSTTPLLLRPYEICPEFEKREDQAKDQNSEYIKFQNSTTFKKMAQDVSTRLGFKYTLNPKQIDNIFDMCRYDQSWFLQDDSPWCAAFTPENVNILEYLEDLKYYYKSSYGSDLNSKVMCAAVKDMVLTLQKEEYPKVTAYFSHASAIQLLLTSLGYAKDNDKLRADNYQQMKYRNFKSSVLSPLASNLAVVKYDCPGDSERSKVQFFLNERPIKFDWCNVGLCNLSKLVETYQHFLNSDCSKTYCGGNSGKAVGVSGFILLAAAITSYLF